MLGTQLVTGLFAAARRPRRPGPSAVLLDLASNDYPSLSRRRRRIGRQWPGAGASRLVSGTRPVHLQPETEIATWTHCSP